MRFPESRIEINPAVHHGAPVIRGTRVPVSRIVGSLQGGMTSEEVQRDYGVTHEDVIAAIEYTARNTPDKAS